MYPKLYDFNCPDPPNCEAQRLVIDNGIYLLEAWGAEGGGPESVGGGHGGYARGIFINNKTRSLYIFVGEQGLGLSSLSYEVTMTRFAFGGGAPANSSLDGETFSGGGMSFISLDEPKNESGIIFAGGGGSSANCSGHIKYGGFGGGFYGGNGTEESTGANPYGPGVAYDDFYKFYSNASQFSGGSMKCKPETITDPPKPPDSSRRNPLYAVYIPERASTNGGGGGYYGGASGGCYCAGSGGGSSYISSLLIDGETIPGNSFMPSPTSNGKIIGNSGHGHVRISKLDFVKNECHSNICHRNRFIHNIMAYQSLYFGNIS